MLKRIAALLGCFAVSFALAGPPDPFVAFPAGTRNVAATSVSAATALAAPGRTQITLYNSGSVIVFVEFGSSGVAATTTTGYPVGPGMKEVVGIDPAATHFAAITASGTATLYATIGSGN